MTRKKGKEAGSQRTTPVGGGRGNDKELKEGCKRKLQKWNKNQTFHRNEPWVWNGAPSATGFNVPMCVCGSKEGGAQMKQDRLCDDWWHEWWVPRGSPRYFIHFQFLRFFFFFKILKVSHWTQIFKKNLYNGLHNLALSSPVTSLASFPPTPCYSLSSPGTPLTLGLCKGWSLCSELSVLRYPHSLLTYWE